MSRRLRRMPSRSWCVLADRQSSTLSAGSFLAELGKERGASFLEGGELGAELFELAVDAGQFGPCLLLADVPIAVQGPGEVLDFATQQAQPRVSVHRGGAVLELARVDRVVDLVLCQPVFQAGGFVAYRRALASPLVTVGAVHERSLSTGGAVR